MTTLLPGFRDFYPEDCNCRNFIFTLFRKVARSFGFEEFDAPILEPLELFTSKSGPEIAEQLFNFADRGGRLIALRPEMTPSLARLVGAKSAALKKPIRWFNIGENFRYERPQKGRLRSFYQMNADLLGESSTRADGELISLLIAALQNYGLTEHDFLLRISDRQLWTVFLYSFGLKDSLAERALQIVDKIEREDPKVSEEKFEILLPKRGKEIYEAIHQLCSCRSINELRDFFRQLSGFPSIKRLDDWEILLDHLAASGYENIIQVDPSIVRGLAYYTGFVFEAFERVENGEKGRALAGGGRYDELLWKLMGVQLPATGFAIGDVTLRMLLEKKGLLPEYRPAANFFLIYEEAVRHEALALAQQIRAKGFTLVYSLVDNQSISKQVKQADKAGSANALIFGTKEKENKAITLKNLSNGSSESLSLDAFFTRLVQN